MFILLLIDPFTLALINKRTLEKNNVVGKKSFTKQPRTVPQENKILYKKTHHEYLQTLRGLLT